MSPHVEDIVERIHETEAELVRAVDAPRRRWHYRVHHANGVIAYVREGYRRHLGALRKTSGREPARGRRS